jgi:hypothetical protein
MLTAAWKRLGEVGEFVGRAIVGVPVIAATDIAAKAVSSFQDEIAAKSTVEKADRFAKGAIDVGGTIGSMAVRIATIKFLGAGLAAIWAGSHIGHAIACSEVDIAPNVDPDTFPDGCDEAGHLPGVAPAFGHHDGGCLDPVMHPSTGPAAKAGAVPFGSWEYSPSGYQYERDPDGVYTGRYFKN